MNITKEFIISVSVNDAAVKNGSDLVKKKQFSKIFTDKDKIFLSGECAGSGKKPYICSVDFINEAAPVYRCTCPSRQIPCKHVVGLMLAFAEGVDCGIAEIPEEILVKRANKEKRASKAKEKLETAESPAGKEKSAAWIRSAVKKIDSQLTGIGEAEKILLSIVQSGLGSIDAKGHKSYLGIVKQLDSYFIPGIQNEFNDLLGMIGMTSMPGIPGESSKHGAEDGFAVITEKICRIHTLLSKSKAYFETKSGSPDKPDTGSEIEELTGYAWKLEELAQFGLFETDTRLAELCFHVRREDEKKQFVDEGFYISLNSGRIFKTRNYRPFKAVKYIKEQDSVFSVLKIPKLYIYPSCSLNPRVRWDESVLISYESLTPEVCKIIKSYANSKFPEVFKQVKNQLKNLMLPPNPLMLVKFNRIVKVDDENNPGDAFVIYDAGENPIYLKQSGYCQQGFIFLLEKIAPSELEDNALLLLFENNIETGILSAQPLALITNEKIIRLVY